MVKYFIDVNLPTRYSLWNSPNFTFIKNIDTSLSDSKTWELVDSPDSIIVTKNRNFYNRILQSTPRPRIIYIWFGNIKMKAFHEVITHG